MNVYLELLADQLRKTADTRIGVLLEMRFGKLQHLRRNLTGAPWPWSTWYQSLHSSLTVVTLEPYTGGNAHPISLCNFFEGHRFCV